MLEAEDAGVANIKSVMAYFQSLGYRTVDFVTVIQCTEIAYDTKRINITIIIQKSDMRCSASRDG